MSAARQATTMVLTAVVMAVTLASGGSAQARATTSRTASPRSAPAPALVGVAAVSEPGPAAPPVGQRRPAPVRPPAVPRRPVPPHSGRGPRIVYSERTPQHVWLVGTNGRVVRDFAVSGRPAWPVTGTFHVFSKSPRSWSSTYGVSFRWMVRFAHGHHAAIGFHTIPRYPSGRLLHPVSLLGRPVGLGGCPHSADADAAFLYRWSRIGTTVVVVR